MGASTSSPETQTESSGGFTCDEEPVMLTRRDGYGYCPIAFGDLMKEGRYEIMRKLGWGGSSVVYLARDRECSRFLAMKVLTAYLTALSEMGYVAEMPILQRITTANTAHPGYKHVTPLLDHFSLQSKFGEHLVFCTDVMGVDLETLRRSQPNRRFALVASKRIVRQLLLALNYLHDECGVIHTDLKPANAMVALDDSESVFRSLLVDQPSAAYSPKSVPELSPEPFITLKSQPTPPSQIPDDGGNILVRLSDYGHSTWKTKHHTEDIQPVSLRAPEVVLGYPWSTGVDIWSLGCLVFEFLTGRSLFNPTKGPTWTTEQALLVKHMVNTGETFPTAMLRQAQKADQYFDPVLYRDPKVQAVSTVIGFPPPQFGGIEAALRNYNVCMEEEIRDTAGFMRRCLAFDPEHRSSAKELLEDSWLGTAI